MITLSKAQVMKRISKLYTYDDAYFFGKIPQEAFFIPETDHAYPVFFRENLITDTVCDQMVDTIRGSGTLIMVPKGPDGRRKTAYFELFGWSQNKYEQAFKGIKEGIASFFNAEITGSHGAHGLGYYPECYYHLHADNCNPVYDGEGQVLRFEHSMPKRQISTILFLTDSVPEITSANQCIGGNVSFNYLRDEDDEMLLVEPKKGLLVAFPSNPVFAHQVHEVFDGYRLTIVDWHAARFL